jgi:flagellar hook-associated protein 1
MPIQSGALAGFASLRDDTAVTYQGQLDQIANGLISATSEAVPSGTTTTQVPGLFTFTGASGTPPAMPSSATGLAGTIEVNPAVDPSQGGNPELVGNGINTNFNTAGDASFTTQIQNLITNLQADQTFSASAGLGTTSSLSNFASSSVSWLEAARQSNSNEGSFQSTLLTSTTSAFTGATGVSLDNEMSKMLDLENSYSSSAQLMTTINSMFTTLVSAVTAINGASA